MGLIVMSERDLQRIEVLSKVTEGRRTIASAAHVLALSTRQVRRLLDVFEDVGAAAIRHKSLDRPSNIRISNCVRDYVLTLIQERYLDFGPTLAAEKLAENHSVAVSRETLLNHYSRSSPAGNGRVDSCNFGRLNSVDHGCTAFRKSYCDKTRRKCDSSVKLRCRLRRSFINCNGRLPSCLPTVLQWCVRARGAGKVRINSTRLAFGGLPPCAPCPWRNRCRDIRNMRTTGSRVPAGRLNSC
jgi:Winged helix-turn helix